MSCQFVLASAGATFPNESTYTTYVSTDFSACVSFSSLQDVNPRAINATPSNKLLLFMIFGFKYLSNVKVVFIA
jgi:hypothetical protein